MPFDEHWNVYIAQWGFYFATDSSYRPEVFSAMASARTTAFELVPDRGVPGAQQCQVTDEYGTGFNVGYTSLVSSHHSNPYDSAAAAYRFGLPHPDPAFGGSPDFTVDDPLVRQRMYRMGMEHYHNSTTSFRDFLEPQILNWTFAVGEDWYLTERRDAVLRVVERPRCLNTSNANSEERVWGPGLFFDWLNPQAISQYPLRADSWLYAAHVNSFYFRGPRRGVAPNPNPLSNNQMSLVLQDDPDLWHLASLPGYMGQATDCLELEIGCTNNSPVVVSDYQGCYGTSVDLNRGSSGGAVFTLFSGHIAGIEQVYMGSAWGIVHGGEVSTGTPNFWGRDDDAIDGFNAPEFPVDGDQTIFTAFSSGMKERVRIHNTTAAPATGPDPADTTRRPEVSDVIDFSQCSGNCVYRECVGDCRDSSLSTHSLVCSALYREYQIPGMGVGLTGGIQDINRAPFIGDFGLVCAPWSSWSWTNFWQIVGHVSHAVRDYLFDYGGSNSTRISIEKPFSTSLITDSLDHFELNLPVQLDVMMQQRPFQMCPPAHHLAAVNFSLDPQNRFIGVHSIDCRSTHNPSVIQTMDLLKPSTNKSWTVTTWIGDPHAGPNATLGCSNAQGSMAISGLRVHRDTNQLIRGVTAYCSSVPAARSTPNECEAPTPSGAPTVRFQP